MSSADVVMLVVLLLVAAIFVFANWDRGGEKDDKRWEESEKVNPDSVLTMKRLRELEQGAGWRHDTDPEGEE